ncbi:translation elongation factor Ts [Rothia mucilaginosa DY-18]|uniref:Elongation factor Ts n=2 Tax=Rothia mucilaginosa TaxID=43675 RepID=D2NNW2_ROTMD|nr:translation elongation factor Ts [Rothia mucilaginosa DY-18]
MAPACGDHVRTAPALTWARRRPPFVPPGCHPDLLQQHKEFTMANYTAADIKALREKTGAGMLDVKKALDEANGDQQKAAEIIRVKGLKGITKREGRATAEGLVAARVENGVGYMIEVNSETDFVAKSDPFIAFGQNVLEAAIAADASTLEELQAASYEGKTVEELTTDAGALLGEKIVVRRVARVEGENVAVYLHKTSKDLPAQVGVLLAVSGENTDEIAHDVAVHIAAMSPKYLDSESIPADQIETEKRVARETAIAEGKPEKILDKIVEGRLKGFFKENTLLDQDFAKDSKKSVAQVLSEAGATATAFARFRVGA